MNGSEEEEKEIKKSNQNHYQENVFYNLMVNVMNDDN